MATTEKLYTGDGSQDTYSFTFPYLKTTDIKASISGVVTTDFYLPTATTVKFNTIPADTSEIRIYRETSDESLSSTFYAGSAIKSSDLNDNFTQTLYVTQEANNNIGNTWAKGDPTVISTETWYTTDDTKIASTKAIENRIDTKIDTAIEGDVLAGTDLTKTQTGGQVTINHSVTGAASVDNSNGNVIQDLTINGRGHVTGTGSVNLDDRYYTETELNAGQLDNRYYTETELDAGQLDNRYYTETELLTTGVLDDRYYTETEMDTNFYKVGSLAEIASGETWVASDVKVATTAAIDARIVDLVDDVGGFVPIDNETSFPTTNPDVNNGAGTLVSIKEMASSKTPSGGTVTITDAAGTGNTVTITDCGTTVLSAGFGVIVETTSTLHTYKFHRLTPKATEITTVAGISSAVSTAATNVADINNFADLYQINASQPTTRSDGSTLSEGDMWYDSSNNNVKVYTGSTFDAVSPAQSVLNDIAIVSGQITFEEDLGSIASAVSTGTGNNINTVAGNITNVNTVAGISTDIDTVAGISSNVTTVSGISANVTSVANNSNNINENVNNAANINTCAGVSSNITTVATDISNVNTVAGAILNVNRYAEEYKIQASAPGSPSAGDLWYDTSNNVVKYYNNSSFSPITSGIASVSADTAPELGGHLDCNDKNLTEVGTISGDNLTLDFGTLT